MPHLQISEASAGHLDLGHTEEDRERATGFASQHAVEICDLLMRMPRGLLLLLKTNDCLRSVDHALGQVHQLSLLSLSLVSILSRSLLLDCRMISWMHLGPAQQ